MTVVKILLFVALFDREIHAQLVQLGVRDVVQRRLPRLNANTDALLALRLRARAHIEVLPLDLVVIRR